MRRTARITILEMEFNQGLPVGFFEWNLQEYCNTAKESGDTMKRITITEEPVGRGRP